MKKHRNSEVPDNFINYTALGVIIDGLLNRLGEPDERIERHGEPYLDRWYIVRRHGECNAYLHKFLASDLDDAMHDHPWSSTSLVLSGTFYEETPNGLFLRKTGDVVFRDDTTPHKIKLIDNKPVYTLFITGPKTSDWFFHCSSGKIHWKQYEQKGGC